MRGRGIVRAFEQRQSVPLADLAAALDRRPPERVEGTAVFLTANPDSAPGALLHNLKHNKVLHERNLIVSIRTADRPLVPPAERAQVDADRRQFQRACVLTYGFMESPDVPRDLGLEADGRAQAAQAGQDELFHRPQHAEAVAGRGHAAVAGPDLHVPAAQCVSDPTDFLQIPPGKVLELGEQVTV